MDKALLLHSTKTATVFLGLDFRVLNVQKPKYSRVLILSWEKEYLQANRLSIRTLEYLQKPKDDIE